MVLVLALLKIAVPFALISCYSTPFELKNALKISKATRLFIAPQYLSKTLSVTQEVGIPRGLVYIMNAQVEGHESLEGLVRRTMAANIPHSSALQVPKDTLAWLFFSSGTTGLPKGGFSTHHGVILGTYLTLYS